MLYPMTCSRCGHKDTIQCRMGAKLPVTCPACRKRAWGQDYSAKRFVVNDGVPRTVMQQAERNNKAMGKEQERLRAEAILGPDRLAHRLKHGPPSSRRPGKRP